MNHTRTADEIATALRGNPTANVLHELVRDCDRRRTEIRTRLEAIVPVQGMPLSPAREAAMRDGLESLADLDREIEALRREFAYLDSLEGLANAQAEALKAASVRAAAPGARRKLPGALKRVRAALAELDRAMIEVADLVMPIAELATLPGEAFPLSDAEAAELLEAREAIWAPRNLAVLEVPLHKAEAYPRSFGIVYETRGGLDARIIRRPPPSRVYLPDVAGNATYRGT